jgi:endonuclease YncB( thermonuclease family)
MKYQRAKNPLRIRTGRLSKYKLISILSVAIFGYVVGYVQDYVAQPNEYSIQGNAVVRDGDTLKIKGINIRLYGLDAPELKQPCYKNDVKWMCGVDSKNELEKLAKDKNIFCIPLDEDKYHRSASNCYFAENGIKVNIGQQLVKNGWAVAYETYSPRYIIDELLAKISLKGIWSSQFQQPNIWRKQHGIGMKGK